MGIDPLSLIITFASIAYQQSQYKKAQREADKRKGQIVSVSGQSVPIPVVYGKQAIGGINVGFRVSSAFTSSTENADNVFSKNFDNTTQDRNKNEFLFVKSILCQGGIEGVQHIKVNDIDYQGTTQEQKDDDSPFRHRFLTHNNERLCNTFFDNQVIGPFDIATGCAHSSNVFRLDRNNSQYSGVPNVEYLVKGRKIRKISFDGTNYTLNTTYEYSNNPSYCLLDYLLNADFGRGLSVNEVDLKSFYDAAQICDTVVVTDAEVGGQVTNNRPVFRYPTFADFPTTDVSINTNNYVYLAEDTNQLYTQSGSGNSVTYTPTDAVALRDLPLYECNITLDTSERVRDNTVFIWSI